jgi:hypothetical protein
LIEPRRFGVLDAPLSRGMTALEKKKPAAEAAAGSRIA